MLPLSRNAADAMASAAGRVDPSIRDVGENKNLLARRLPGLQIDISMRCAPAPAALFV
jgi:hypothetical protein